MRSAITRFQIHSIAAFSLAAFAPRARPQAAPTTPVTLPAPAKTTTPSKDPADDIKDSVTFKHYRCGPAGSECRVAYALDLNDGQWFKIHIDSTILAEFTYDVAGVLLADASKANLNAVEYGTKILPQQHQKKYGGYIVSIRRKGATSSLPEATLIVSVRTRQWTLAFGGGFPVSTITDKVFSLHDSSVSTPGATASAPPTTTTKYLVVREGAQEDRVSLATATFIHLSRTSHPNVGVSFGLGVGGNTTYYFGPSWMFGDLGAFTIGAAFGSRKELPAGVHLNELTTNANAVATLPNRNTGGAFVSFSFTFLGSSSAFEKPFKGTETPPASGNATTGPGNQATPPAGTADTKLTVTPKTLKPGAEATFTITIGPAPEGKPFQAGDFQVAVASGPFTISSASLPLEPTDAGKHAQGTFKAKLNQDATGSVKLEVHVVGQGYDAKITSEAVTVSTQP